MPYPMRPLEPERGARQWFGAELRLHRKRHNLSQQELGQRVYVSGDTIGKIEKAERSCALELARALDSVLETGGVLERARTLVAAEADKRRPEADKPRKAPAPIGEHPLLREMLEAVPSPSVGASLNRRKFLTAGVGLAFGTAVPESASSSESMASSTLRMQVDQLAAGCIDLGSRPRIGKADVARLNAVHGLYQSLDYQYGGGLVYESVNQIADASTAFLDRDYPAQLGTDLLNTIANLRLLAGWTAFDMCDHASGLRHFAGAERLANRAGNTSLAIYVHYCQARQLQHLRQNRDAVEVLRAAQDHYADQATPGAWSVLDATIAPSLAALGDRDGALAALNRATDSFERMIPGDEPPWIGWMDRAELAAQFGRVYRDFARQDRNYADQAVEWTQQAIAGFDEGMQRSSLLNEVGLCSASFLAGDADAGVRIGTRLLENPPPVVSQRVKERIVNIARDARLCTSGSSEVDDFIHVIADA
ncbi:helix-turn-helix domain-containing protein [Glycomyces sp. A-F 0318]|uniref:helix-turn-helix transcriptional regulator n=1 Tax=Glycomyces amatae TaxID=2881355 RepID=UPI001E28AD38|nr:helix-turn-helix transcriptional regulator [Glycomyces amatae]MCD0444275.1 helix-turn-helix domain-containing protein [Glycomyces amatae]